MAFLPTDVLLIIDVQNDFCPGGALAVPEGDAVVPVINGLIAEAGRAGATIVLTQDWHPVGHSSFASSHAGRQPFQTITMPYGEQVLWPNHCVQDSLGAAFHPDLRSGAAQAIIRKGGTPTVDSYSAFFENDHQTATGLQGYLQARGVTRVIGCGLATDYCVSYSLLDARAIGLQAVLIEDASRGIDLDGSVGRALAALAQAGVTITTAQGFCP